jgi:hypothetical protein
MKTWTLLLVVVRESLIIECSTYSSKFFWLEAGAGCMIEGG